MKEYQLKFDIFNVKCPIVEQPIKHEVKRENKAKVVLCEVGYERIGIKLFEEKDKLELEVKEVEI